MGALWLLIVAAVGAGAFYLLGARRARLSAHRDTLARVRRLKGQVARAEEQAGRASELLSATGTVVSNGLLQIDDQQKIVACNDRARAWFELDIERQPSVMAGVGSAELREAIETALCDDTRASEPIRVRIDQRVFRVAVRPLLGGGAVVALRDDTELRQLARAQRDLVANVSHDLRTPLTSLSLLVDSIADGFPKGKQARASVVARIREQIVTLGTTADALVELNLLDSGRALLRLEPESLESMAAQAAEGLAEQLDDSCVTVRNEISVDVMVLADRPKIVRVFSNLLENARQHSPAGGVIAVGSRGSDKPDRVEVFVRDQGPGIAPAEAQRVFERFYRGDAARSGDGRGLGLAITRHIVEGHGGLVWIDSDASVQGTTVRFTLPLAR